VLLHERHKVNVGHKVASGLQLEGNTTERLPEIIGLPIDPDVGPAHEPVDGADCLVRAQGSSEDSRMGHDPDEANESGPEEMEDPWSGCHPVEQVT
jgi:hypothetical protein